MLPPLFPVTSAMIESLIHFALFHPLVHLAALFILSLALAQHHAQIVGVRVTRT
jgi:hypothetical protein